MSTSRAERSRLAPSIAINQDFEFESCRFPDFHAFSKSPPLSKIRQNQEIDEIKRRNGIFVENQKFTESHNEILRRKAVVDCFDCYERMPNRDILEMCLGWYQPRHISSKRPSKNTTIETCLCAMLSFRKLRKTFFKSFFNIFKHFRAKTIARYFFKRI